MAGDWIKMRLSLSREPEVVGMSIKTGIDTHGIVGRLHAVWAWADEVAEGGAVRFVGKAYIDRLTECDGFADAMEEVGWLKVKGDTVTFPNFDKHNGKSAKARADAASRKRKSRNAVPKAESGECHKNVTESCDKSVTREEKRREEEEEGAKRAPSGAFDDFVDDWNAMATRLKLPIVRSKSRSRRAKFTTRCREPGWLDLVPEALEAIEASSFCRGTNGRDWTADIDWLLKPDSVARLVEGKYADANGGAKAKPIEYRK